MDHTSRSLEFVSKETLCQRGETEEECEASDKITGKQTCQMEMRLMMLRKQV